MDLSPAPALRRRQVGARLRQLRDAAGKAMDEVAAYLECSTAKISRIETGRLLARVPDVRNMLDLYNVHGVEREELLELVRQSRQKGWWHNYPEALVSEGYGTYLGLLDAAATIDEYQPYLLPGLLHTADYAYAVFGPQAHLLDTQIDRMVELRLAAQREILERSNPPAARFFIDEAAVHRFPEGAAVMRAQLEHIIDLARTERVTVQLVPFSAGFTPAYGLPFVVIGLPDATDPKIVYVEHLYDSHFETKLDTVNRYTWVVENLAALALSPAETVANLAQRLT